jgi:hypothetical protein
MDPPKSLGAFLWSSITEDVTNSNPSANRISNYTTWIVQYNLEIHFGSQVQML